MNSSGTYSQLTFLTISSCTLFHSLSQISCLLALIKNSGSFKNNTSYLKRINVLSKMYSRHTEDTLHFRNWPNKTQDSGIFLLKLPAEFPGINPNSQLVGCKTVTMKTH